MDINKINYRRNLQAVEQLFLDHFQLRGYEVIPGSSLLDPSVPMSFVMSAGLVQVEQSVAKQGGRNNDRYALLQNCFRYFDLDMIGLIFHQDILVFLIYQY